MFHMFDKLQQGGVYTIAEMSAMSSSSSVKGLLMPANLRMHWKLCKRQRTQAQTA